MLSANEALRQLDRPTFDFHAVGGPKDWTPLHVACYSGSFEVIHELIGKTGADVFARSLCQKVPRQVARNTVVAKIVRLAEKKIIREQLKLDEPRDAGRFLHQVGENSLIMSQLQD